MFLPMLCGNCTIGWGEYINNLQHNSGYLSPALGKSLWPNSGGFVSCLVPESKSVSYEDKFAAMS